ncbi:DUF2178 domain-containing protein [Halalkalibacillus halophilus]|uniref:DUF2178 domain-containing protein n=1 Tax=Halalkalibacillus halophilus TaxID=392827 RepID=UPI000486485C|nr:DUF2178 domain-containing protein [Halalkalibacillus halophilus]
MKNISRKIILASAVILGLVGLTIIIIEITSGNIPFEVLSILGLLFYWITSIYLDSHLESGDERATKIKEKSAFYTLGVLILYMIIFYMFISYGNLEILASEFIFYTVSLLFLVLAISLVIVSKRI